MNKELGQKFFNLEFNSPIVLLSGCVGFGDEYTRMEIYPHVYFLDPKLKRTHTLKSN